MRVGVIGPIHPDSLAQNIVQCLPELGVTAVALGAANTESSNRLVVRGFEIATRLGAEAERLIQRPVVRRAQDAACDVIINVQQALMPETVQGLKDSGSRVCLWYPDAVSNIGRMSLISGDYDALFLKDPLLVERLTNVYGMPALYVPEACNPKWHRPVGDPSKERHIVVAGNIYPTRARLLLKLQQDGIPLRLYGSGFPRWFDPGPLAASHAGRPIFELEKSQAFREARGVLNNLHPAEMQSVNARLFEATAAGGAVLCERRGSLAALFDDRTEVCGFSSYRELLTICRNLLDDAELGEEIGNAASARARAEHTYAIRLREMITFVT